MNVRTLCLGVLQFGEATGYEIKKIVEEGMFNHFIEASYGSIYPALTRQYEITPFCMALVRPVQTSPSANR